MGQKFHTQDLSLLYHTPRIRDIFSTLIILQPIAPVNKKVINFNDFVYKVVHCMIYLQVRKAG